MVNSTTQTAVCISIVLRNGNFMSYEKIYNIGKHMHALTQCVIAYMCAGFYM